MSEQSEQMEWIKVSEAAVIMKVTDGNVAYLCRKGRIRCQKWGNTWQVSKEDAETYERSKRNPTWLHEENETED